MCRKMEEISDEQLEAELTQFESSENRPTKTVSFSVTDSVVEKEPVFTTLESSCKKTEIKNFM